MQRTNRRNFLRASGASLAGGAGALLGSDMLSPNDADAAGQKGGAPAPGALHLVADPETEFIVLMSLGKAYYSCGSVGRVLAIAGEIRPGDGESAYQAFWKAGEEARALADEQLARHRSVSARQAYLWATNYFYYAGDLADGSKDPNRFKPTWERARDCWDRAVALFDPPVEKIAIPYEGTTLQGYFFRADRSSKRRPLLILNNGSDGSVQDMWVWGAAGGTARGYNCLTFDGPGQGAALWRQGLHFRPDWEKVITPVVDYALTRPDVDPKRIALQGISQGGYWVPRAVAFERRIAAAVADPGVVDVSTSWIQHLPPEMVRLLDTGQKDAFNAAMAEAPPELQAALRFRMRPYGLPTAFDVLQASRQYNLRGVADKIRCPMLITDPDNETFWPGQSQQLYQMLRSPKRLVRFTAAEGADLHCEPKDPGLRDLRVFDWLDEVLA